MTCAVRAIGMEEVHPEFFPIGGESRWSVHIRSSSAIPPIINCNKCTFFRLSSFALSFRLRCIYSVYCSAQPSIHLLANEGAHMEEHASSEASSATKLQCSFLSCQSIIEMILEKSLVLINSKRLIRGTVYPNSGRQREASRLKMESKVSDILRLEDRSTHVYSDDSHALLLRGGFLRQVCQCICLNYVLRAHQSVTCRLTLVFSIFSPSAYASRASLNLS